MQSTFVQRTRVAALIVVASLAMTGSAGAQTITDEVRCVLLSNALAAGAKDAHARQVGASVGSYFMGRLDARQPAQVRAAMAGQNRKMAAGEAMSLMNACAARASRAESQLRALAK